MMSMKFSALSFILILLASCNPNSPIPENPKADSILETIKGRDEAKDDLRRIQVYHIQTPKSWIRKDPLPDHSITDTKEALVEFIIKENQDLIRISIHNFPYDKSEERIPQIAQVTRWQNQFQHLEKELSSITQDSFNGYSALVFEGVGVMDGEKKQMLAYAMQLPKVHFNALLHPKEINKIVLYRQMRGDVTIKAVGNDDLMEKHKDAIIAFAKSFEMIEEIPQEW